jgi:hypothetical protein
MRWILFLMLILAIITPGVQALSYSDEPFFTAYIAGSNYVDKGEDTTLQLVIQNSAILRKVTYDDFTEYTVFSSDPTQLLIAYNVTLSFEGDGEVTPLVDEMKFPAIKPFQPLQIPLKVRIDGNASSGEHQIKVKVKYEVIDSISISTQSSSIEMPKEIHEEYTPSLPNLTKTTIIKEYTYQSYTNYLKYKFNEKEQEITLRVVVEEGIQLRIENVSSSLVAKGKGEIKLEVVNTGEKEAKNLFLILSTPSGIVPVSTQQKLPEFDISMLTQMLPTLAGFEMPQQTLQLPPEVQSALSKGVYFVGDLKPGEKANATFKIKAGDEPGLYAFQIRGVYIDENGNVRQTDTIPFGVEIEEAPKFRVISSSSSLYAGSKGDVSFRIEVTKPVEGLRVEVVTNPPLSAIVKETFVGDVGGVFNVSFKLKALSDAEGVYPAKLKFTYSLGGEDISEEVDAGVEVKPKMKFEVEGKGSLEAGSEKFVTVAVRNAGNFEVRDATARITVVDPFSTTDDTAYIGTLRPGESKNVTFKLKVDGDATPKLYALNLEVKYRDVSGEWVISEPVKMPIEVKEKRSRIPMTGAITLLILAGSAIAYGMSRKKQDESDGE